jgi:hypothetical protein
MLWRSFGALGPMRVDVDFATKKEFEPEAGSDAHCITRRCSCRICSGPPTGGGALDTRLSRCMRLALRTVLWYNRTVMQYDMSRGLLESRPQTLALTLRVALIGSRDRV